MKTKPNLKEAACDLSSLSRFQLNRHHSAMLTAAKAASGGSSLWRHRKAAEAHELLALAQHSKRLLILQLDLTTDIRVDFCMRVTVPCMPNPNGPLEIGDSVRLGLIYREEALVLPQPGFSFIQILAPRAVFHPNVSRGHDSHNSVQVLCLGPQLPAGIQTRELILGAYQALTLMAVQLNPGDSAGVLNQESAEWFQRNPRLIPLSREPFLANPELTQ